MCSVCGLVHALAQTMRTGLSVFVRERILGASLQYITNLLVARVDFPFLKRRLWAVPFFIIQFLPRPHSHDHKEYFAPETSESENLDIICTSFAFARDSLPRAHLSPSPRIEQARSTHPTCRQTTLARPLLPFSFLDRTRFRWSGTSHSFQPHYQFFPGS